MIIKGVDDIRFNPHGDDRGKLIAIENNKDIPFEIRRVYYIYGASPDSVRGKHAHKNLKQVMLCVKGFCDILIDNGKERATVRLDDPSRGIYIDGFVWREMKNFSPDCVLLVLVDQKYDPADYIFDYDIVAKTIESGE